MKIHELSAQSTVLTHVVSEIVELSLGFLCCGSTSDLEFV